MASMYISPSCSLLIDDADALRSIAPPGALLAESTEGLRLSLDADAGSLGAGVDPYTYAEYTTSTAPVANCPLACERRTKK